MFVSAAAPSGDLVSLNSVHIKNKLPLGAAALKINYKHKRHEGAGSTSSSSGSPLLPPAAV